MLKATEWVYSGILLKNKYVNAKRIYHRILLIKIKIREIFCDMNVNMWFWLCVIFISVRFKQTAKIFTIKIFVQLLRNDLFIVNNFNDLNAINIDNRINFIIIFRFSSKTTWTESKIKCLSFFSICFDNLFNFSSHFVFAVTFGWHSNQNVSFVQN